MCWAGGAQSCALACCVGLSLSFAMLVCRLITCDLSVTRGHIFVPAWPTSASESWLLGPWDCNEYGMSVLQQCRAASHTVMLTTQGGCSRVQHLAQAPWPKLPGLPGPSDVVKGSHKHGNALKSVC
jgi:hypothetical protein